MQKIIYIIVCLLLVCAGCSSARRVSGPGYDGTDDGMAVMDGVLRNNITNYGFNIKRIDINYNINGVSGRFIAAVRHRNPDTVLIVLKHTTGIEIGRVYMDSDTILINDRINRRLMYGDPGNLEAKYGIDKKAIMIILGDILIDDVNEIRKYKNMNCQKGILKSQARINERNINYEIDCGNLKTVSATITRGNVNDKISVWYDNFIRRGNYVFPGRIEAEDIGNKARIIAEIRNIEIPWEGRIEFIPGKGYRPMLLK